MSGYRRRQSNGSRKEGETRRLSVVSSDGSVVSSNGSVVSSDGSVVSFNGSVVSFNGSVVTTSNSDGSVVNSEAPRSGHHGRGRGETRIRDRIGSNHKEGDTGVS